MKYFIVLILITILVPINVYAISSNEVETLLEKTESLIAEQKEYENIDKYYPIGSIYISINKINPSSLIGGTWESFGQSRQLIGVGSNGKTNYTSANMTGGNSSITLNSSNIPAHTHSLTPSGTVSSTFTGTSVTTSSNGDHTHTVSFGWASNEAKGFGLKTTNYSSTDCSTYNDRVLVRGGSVTIQAAGAHTHSLTPSGTVSSTFTGQTVTTSSVGSVSSIDIINPYTTVYIWKRVA